ncbi:MAG TPA: serine/threonine-protein kinase [Solirubrobacteraceae bacterium]
MNSAKTLVQSRRNGSSVAGWRQAYEEGDNGREPSPPPRARDPRIGASDERAQADGGTLLGRYRLLGRLGTGGFGTVWRAHDEQLDRPVAIKRIPLPSLEDRERATREAHATARLSHPAIVALFEASADGDAFYLISELVEGDTLARLIAEDELCDEDIAEIGLVLVGALEHAHARGVIHRDVKPQNVLVCSREAQAHTPSLGGAPSPVAKLADFGGARLAGDDALTRTGDVLGTLAYMAPEQSEGHEAGPPADLYSLALVLYEAFSGANPVRGRTPAATARNIGSRIEPLERRRRDLPRELARALDKALQRDPRSRGTLADLHEALEEALDRGFRRRPFDRRPSARVLDRPPEWSFPEEDFARRRERELDPARRRRAQPRTQVVPVASSTGAEAEVLDSSNRRRIALPRLMWIGCLLAATAWQAAVGRGGVSLLLLVAGAPLILLPRRAGPGWLAAALAPVLGLAGLAGAFPALAGQRSSWRARAGLAALGFWWLALAEPLLAKRLWLGPPTGVPPRAVWEASAGKAASHVVGATLTFELLIGAVAWALAAAILPWIVRGRGAALDVAAAVGWTVALLAATPLLERALLSHASQPSPRGALIGAVSGCALAIGARALRGPV